MSFAARSHWGGVTANTPNINVVDNTLAGAGGTRTVSFSLSSAGTGSTTGSTTSTPGSFTWRTSGASSDYEVQVVGSVTSGSGGSFTGVSGWNSLGTTRTFSFQNTDNDSTWTGTYQIRLAAGGTVLNTGTVSMRVNSAP